MAQDLKADGFAQAATVHSELFRLKNGRTRWDSRTLVVVDEAAMLDSRVTGELLAEAKRSGAKLVLAGDDRQLASIDFAVGDRVQFTDTLKAAKIYNGNAGTISGVDAASGTVRVRLDGAGGQGREVTWSASAFAGFRHGYAGTIYKGQGKTLDHTYLLHSHHWRQASSYVALTRQRETATIFVATETARDAKQLAWQMARVEVRSASVAWATADEVPATQAEVRRQRDGQAQGTDGALTRALEPGHASAKDEPVRTAKRQRQPDAPRHDTDVWTSDADASPWLIPPRVSPDGRDSLGRGIDPDSIAFVVSGDAAVRRERDALRDTLRGGYRDPDEAYDRLSELLRTDGATSVARRFSSDPGQLGELRGRTGWLAGRAAREERARAERVLEAVGPAVSRMAEAETRAAQSYRGAVEARLAAEATGVPQLSERAQAALAGVANAKDDAAKAKAWTAIGKSEGVAREIDDLRTAVAKRFGDDGVRTMLRGEWRGTGPYEGDGSVATEHRVAAAEVARAVATATSGEMAADRQEQTERLAQGQSQRAGLRP